VNIVFEINKAYSKEWHAGTFKHASIKIKIKACFNYAYGPGRTQKELCHIYQIFILFYFILLHNTHMAVNSLTFNFLLTITNIKVSWNYISYQHYIG
jgi:hypothetical protein